MNDGLNEVIFRHGYPFSGQIAIRFAHRLGVSIVTKREKAGARGGVVTCYE